jgi:carotenoid cleavage dioxygenase
MTILDASAYVEGNFGPVTEELTVTDLNVVGHIPEELEGRLLRNGPNPIGDIDMKMHHWFLGDGMVHGVRLRGGKAEWYRNRFVGSQRTSELLGIHGQGELAATSGPNTNVIGHAGKTYALVEAGTKPVELTYELETVRTNGFNDSLLNGYTAHPKYDPLTGEMHAVCYSTELLDKVQYVVVGADGSMTKTVTVSVPTMPMIHDMALTQKYAVVMDLPVAVDLELAMGGSPFPVRWFDDYNARLGLLPRTATDESEIVWCEIDPCFAFHPLNSYDTPDGKLIIDICVFARIFDVDRNGPFRDAGPVLERWTVDPVAGKVHRETTDDRVQEFPRVAGKVLNQKHRFGYTGGVDNTPGSFGYGDTYKYDFELGTTVTHDHGQHRQAGEPVFVSRSGGQAEDDGWILTTVYDGTTDTSDVVVLNADDLDGDEVARIQLPARIPHGFHGNWVRDSVTPPPA